MFQEKPTHRRLRGYAFDPSLSKKIDTVDINNIVYKVPWEEPLEVGPVGEYVEVMDYDPTIEKFYSPVDLNDKYILASDGLSPSESNPQFHQQMTYAVAMVTIQNFEKALGRKIIWAPRLLEDRNKYEDYVQRLRIYPHALREANAYYSPLKKAILCGYFSASPADKSRQMPGSLVFTCLSHDIIAHEVTHAILDGLHRYYNHPTNPDVLAFHEAFADLVALFQHFTFPDVLKHQIAKTKGELGKQNLLGQLAQQFGTAIGRYGSLRDALGSEDEKGEWTPAKPNPYDYDKHTEPHKRGSILVAAVFEAFLAIYKRRIQDLLQIASGGTGILPKGELHPDLVNRLAREASKTAAHVLRMCIRAIDYCPPVDITFGDYLRGIITADSDMVPEDTHHYRLAFINAFRQRGIYPEGIKTLSEESLRYQHPSAGLDSKTKALLEIITDFLKDYRNAIMYETDREKIFNISKDHIAGRGVLGLHDRIGMKFKDSPQFEKLTGLVFNHQCQDFGIWMTHNGPSYQIQNLRLVSRVGPDGGDPINQIVFGLVQRMRVVRKNGKYRIPDDISKPPKKSFEVLGGCTLIFDLDKIDLKYAISKPLLQPEKLDTGARELNFDRIEKHYIYETEVLPFSLTEAARYFGNGFKNNFGEPFSIMHNR